MEISLDNADIKYQIRGYEPGILRINQEQIQHSVIIDAVTLTPWAPENVATLRAEHFLELLDYQPEVILIGTGAKLEFPDMRLLQGLIQAQCGYEIMDTAAACRTFQVLTSERRKVLAALLV